MQHDEDDYYYGQAYSEVYSMELPKKNKKSDDIYKHKQRIKEINRSGMSSKEVLKEIEDLNKKIEELQSNCYHNWEIVTLFQLPKRICKECDMQDLNYSHK